MKWLEIDWIKAHSSIDYDCDDALLELYANSAENALLRTIGRTYDEVVKLFGTPDQPVPPDLIHASLMLVDVALMITSSVKARLSSSLCFRCCAISRTA